MASKKSKRKIEDRHNRWVEIRGLFRDGWEVDDLAWEFDISRRLVRKILKKDMGFMRRATALRELIPAINALFGLDYERYKTKSSELGEN